LTVAGLETDSLRPFAGISADSVLTRGTVRILPEARLLYAREVLDTNRRSELTTGAGELLRMTNAVPGRDYLTIGAGVAVRSANIEVFADYDATLPVDNVTRHSVSAGLRYRF
jgi:uncharacterized protein with beta-barrel porin domain